MWKNILKGSAIMVILLAILAAIGVAAVDHDLKNTMRQPLDDNDIM